MALGDGGLPLYSPNINSREKTSINGGDEDKLKAAEPKHFPGQCADAEPEIKHDRDWKDWVSFEKDLMPNSILLIKMT